jgi:prophage antirepressor-like protein
MANEMLSFTYGKNAVRTVQRGDGVWWVLKDVCEILAIDNYRNVSARLDIDEKGVHTMDTLGGKQELTIIS